MASITQTIPSFTGGISQQPDELVLPGQVKDLVNGIPDITDGLVKRPGSRFLNSLTGASTGTWFSYYRDKFEGAYIGQVQRNGAVKIWHANDVYDSNGNKTDSAGDLAHDGSPVSYLAHANDASIKFLTVADTTFVTNVTQVVSVNTSVRADDRAQSIGAANSGNIYQAFVELRQLAPGREYSFSVASANDTLQPLTSSGEGRAVSINVVPQTGTQAGAPNNYNTINGRQGRRLDPSCEYQGTQTYIVNNNSGSGRNLGFRLTNTAQVVVDSRNNTSTIEGDDYVAIYNTTVELLSGGYGWRPHDGGSNTGDNHVVVNYKGVNFTIQIGQVQEIEAKKGYGFFRPRPTSFDANVEVSADSILTQLEQGSGIGQINLNVVQRVGNGIFLAHNQPFTVETTNPDLWRITPMEVNDASELPRQCKHGMIVKVISSSDSVDDDFYLKFVGNENLDGPGRWEECQAPGVYTGLDKNTMPHVIQRQANGTFTVGTFDFVPRETGDNKTNPFPSLIKGEVANNIGRKIEQTFFHRNRLGFLCEDRVILSRAGEPGNFFQESSLVVGGSDPIDIQASSTKPTRLRSAIETNTGLVVFAETQQFLLHTDSDSLTPETGKLSNISTYRYAPKCEPVSLGTTLGFLDGAGVNGRFFEVVDIRREGEPNMIEQTKVAPKLLPNDISVMTNSRENNTIFFSKKNTNEIFGYRYFNTGDKRAQSAWFKWTLPHQIEHLFVLDDELYIISGDYSLLKIALQKIDTGREATGDNFYSNTATTFDVHLDSSKTVTAGSYNGTHTLVQDTFIFSNLWSSNQNPNGRLAAVDLSTGEIFLEDIDARTSNPNTYYFNGDFAGEEVVVGWLFEMNVKLPKIYVKQKAGEITTSDTTASLTLQRVHFRFGPVGQIHVNLKRLGKDHIETYYDSTFMDEYEADEIPVWVEKTHTVPVYERNKNCNLVLKSYHPGPAQFISLTWEGDYTPMHHRRV